MFQELEQIGPDKIQISEGRLEMGRYIEKEWRHHFLIWATPDITGDLEEELAKALAMAVSQIATSLRHVRKIGVVFGHFPYFAVEVGVGAELYVANMAEERALASSDENRIYVDADRIFDRELLGRRLPSTIILEEFVHAWMNIRREELVEHILRILDGPRYRAQAEEWLQQTLAEHVNDSAPEDT